METVNPKNLSASVRWGLIGYGDLAEKRVAAALQKASCSTLVGIWGRDPQRTSDFAMSHHISHSHKTLDSLLKSDADAIYVCTPPDSHCEYALAAIMANKHVLVEKPMATTNHECERMMEAAHAEGVILGIAYYRRAYPKMQRIKQLINQGILGIPTWVNITSHSWFNPPEDDSKRWRVEKRRSGGGGAVADIGVHRLDLLDYWLGPSKVVYSNLQRLVHSYEVEDASSATLELANGAPVHAYFAWNSKTWMDRFEIVGSEAKIIADPLDGPSLVVIRGREIEHLTIDPPSNPHLPCIEDFVRAIVEKCPPLCNGETGLRTNRLFSAIVEPVAPVYSDRAKRIGTKGCGPLAIGVD